MSKPLSRRAPQAVAHRVLATNRKARHDFVLEERFEAGLVLLGSEVKSLRTNTPSLAEGHARLRDREVWLHGVHIPPLVQAAAFGHEPLRPRQCLLHKRELARLERQLDGEGRTLVPLSLYFKGSRIKVELALARGRKKADRRQREREKEDRRQMRQVRQDRRR